jgi:hypothetical protein
MALLVHVEAEKNRELDKRTYLPGIEIHDRCKKCKTIKIWNGNESYVSYPVLGEPTTVYMYCNECNNEWQIKIILTFNIKIVK